MAWIGLYRPNRDQIHSLADEFQLPGLAVEDVINAHQRPKLERYGETLLVVLRAAHLPLVAAAGIVGFAGNEIVARYRIRIGQRIGSAALIADGLHARTDRYTALAVLAAAGGAALGWRWADPAIGLVIAVAITFVLRTPQRGG